MSAAIAPFLLIMPAAAQSAEAAKPADKAVQSAGGKAHGEAVFSTGVAKGRDRLDSATSTSALRASEFETYGARSLGEVLRNIPGIRAEYAGGEGNANYSIRGLPLSGNGSKYVQLQEDGLPVLEFGDLYAASAPDMFMRADLNVSQVETISRRFGLDLRLELAGRRDQPAVQDRRHRRRRGSGRRTAWATARSASMATTATRSATPCASTSAASTARARGPRDAGYTAYKGGQIKANITKQFENGYVRLYGKWMDDRTPAYQFVPIKVTGTNADPTFSSPANFDREDRPRCCRPPTATSPTLGPRQPRITRRCA
ncbi:Plug domain-containing protein [Caulobacter segnis]